MRQLFILISLLFLSTEELKAQNYYYFSKWKAKSGIEAKKVTIIMDTTNSIEGHKYNESLGTLIISELTKRNINSSFVFMGQQTDMNNLLIQFDQIKGAYVKLNTFGSKIPLCNRFNISQLTKLPVKTNRTIRTTLAISVDKEEQGIKQASMALAEYIDASLKK